MNPQFSSSWSLQTDHVNRYAFIENAFSVSECEYIIKNITEKHRDEFFSGTVKSENTLDLDKEYRNSNIFFMKPDDSMRWVYQKLTDYVNNVNAEFFKFDLFAFGESLQFTEYKAPSGKYNAHIDQISGGVIRKLSIVVQLSDPSSYEGGDFEIIDSEFPTKLSRTQGTLLVFPSYALHRVTELSKGTRHSLVGWINGTPFK